MVKKTKTSDKVLQEELAANPLVAPDVDVAFGFEPSPEVKPLDDPTHDPVAVKAVGVYERFVLWAKGGEQDDITEFIQAGFLDAKFFNLTQLGTDILETESVEWAMTNFIEIGVPITFKHGQESKTLAQGSLVKVMFGGYDKRVSTDFWECYAGENWPLVRVYRHSLHKFTQKPFPAAKPIGT